MPIGPDNLWDKLARAARAVDPANDPNGAHQLQVSGTVNILGGGSGGTAQADDSAFVPGSSSLTPAGAYVGGRTVASGHVGAPAMSASAILQVHVVAGGAGGGLANLTVKGTANNDLGVGFASGPAGGDGRWSVPVVLGSGAIAPVTQRAATRPAATTMQNAATATGNGTSLDVEGHATALVSLTDTWDATITFEASVDDLTWVAILGTRVGDVLSAGPIAEATLQAGDYEFSVAGYKSLRARISVYTSGSVTAKGYVLAAPSAPKAVVALQGLPAYRVTPSATFTVSLDKVATVNLGLGTVNIGAMPGLVGSVRVTNLGGSVGVVGAGGSLGAVNLGGSVGVTPIGDFTVWLANAAAGSALGTVGVYGSVGVVGSVNVTPVASFTVNLASHIDTAGSALRVNVVAGGAGGGVAQLQVTGTSGTYLGVGYASGAAQAVANMALPVLYASGFYATVNVGAMPALVGSVWASNLGGSVGVIGAGGSMGVVNLGGSVSVLGSVNVTPVATFTVSLDKVATVNLGLGTVNVGNGIVGSVNVTPAASFTVNLGSIPTVNLGLGTVNLGNGVVGSVNVTPVASFTVNLGSIPTVNIGLGTVNVGNVVTATIPSVLSVDTSASLTPTVWLINFAGSGYSAISVASLSTSPKTKLYAITLVAAATVDISFQSPSGTFLTGSLRILPGSGFAQNTKMSEPLLIGGANATLFIHSTGTQNIGGWATGWIAP